MDAIIMCAGKGTRLRPITDSIPKPLVPICGRSSLERTLDALPSEVDRIILIVGYLGNIIKERIGTRLDDREVVYVEQGVLNGTGGALRCAQSSIRSDHFLVLNGDDVYVGEDFAELLKYQHALLYKRMAWGGSADAWVIDERGIIAGMEQIEPGPQVNLNVGAYHLGRSWFDTEPVLSPGKTDEWSIPHAVPQIVERGFPVKGIRARFWMPVGTPEQLEEAEKELKK